MEKIKTKYCTEYNDFKLYANTLGVGAICYAQDDNGTFECAIKDIISYLDSDIDNVAQEINDMCGDYDYTGEFITDDYCYYIGANIIKHIQGDIQFEYEHLC